MSTPSESTPAGRGDDLKRALLAMRDLRRRIADLESAAHEPVAIVGMSVRLPGGADSPDRFWDLLRNGVDATREAPAERWDVDAFYDPDPNAPGRAYVRRGGFLHERIDQFDPEFFGISPREAHSIDPTHRLLLELSWEALEHAGIPAHSIDGTNAGVFVGVSGGEYDMLQRDLGLEINSYRGTGAVASVAAGRISHFLGVHGANIAIDTACSSALVALALGVDALRSGRCEIALAGSAHLILSPEGTIMLSKMRALDADGRCRTFDASAAGYARAEGGGMFVLKRLSVAHAAGDQVLAVIRGVAVNHDGRSSSLTVPNANAQRQVIEAALRDAGIAPLDVTYVETHGTATPLGDPIELRVIASVLDGPRPLFLGSVKTNVGHLEPAAGVAGLAKVVLALQHGQIPAHLHVQQLTPHVPWESLNFRVPTALTDWTVDRRIAGISGFGFSGTNAHLIVEQAPAGDPETRPRRPSELIVLSARSRQAVADLASRYRERVLAAGDAGLADLAATSTTGRSALPVRAFAVGADATAMAEALEAVSADPARLTSQYKGASPGPVAMLFTGQGAQYPAMARVLFETLPDFRATVEQCALLLAPHLDQPLLPLLLDDGLGEMLRETRNTQPALFVFEYALAQVWRRWGLEPSYVLGHSLGEYVAATIAGVFALEDALALVALRGNLMQQLPGGGRMAAVFAAEADVTTLLRDLPDVSIAAVNAPANIVISGPGNAVDMALGRLAERGVRHQSLDVSHAFHSSLMDPILDEFERAVAAVPRRPPTIDVISNVTGQVMTAAEAMDPARWRRHLRETVRFAASVRELVARGVHTFVEVGPHPTLCALGAQAAPEAKHWIGSVRRGINPWDTLGRAAGALFQGGHELDWRAWAAPFAGHRGASAPTYPFQRDRYWFTENATITPHVMRSDAGRATGPSATHPLLGAPVQSPLLAGWAYQVSLDAHHPSYLVDHRVQDAVVVPAAVFIEMMHAGIVAGLQWTMAEITALTIERPLVLRPDETTTCQVLISEPVDGRSTVRVVSATTSEDAVRWVTHASAFAHASSTGSGGSLEALGRTLASLRATVSQPFDLDVLQSRLAARGLQYGPAFRTLDGVWTGPNTLDGVLGHASLPPSALMREPSDAYHLHPCLLDSAFQMMDSLTSDTGHGADVFLPAGVDQVHIRRRVGDRCWIHAAPRPGEPDSDEMVADFRMFDDAGVEVATLLGFRARRVRGALRARPEQDLLYEIRWEAWDEPAASLPALDGAWLILEDVGGVGRRLASALTARGGRCLCVRRAGVAPSADVASESMVVDPSSAADWARVETVWSRLGTPAGVIHCWALDPAPASDATGDEWLAQQLALTAVVPDVLRLSGVTSARFGWRAVTSGTGGAADDAGGVGDAGASLHAVTRVLQAEYPALPCRVIDLDPRSRALDSERLLGPLFCDSQEDRLARRDGQWQVPRLERVDALPDPDRRVVPEGESYHVQIARRGTLDALQYVAGSRREPGDDEVEVRVRTTGLNFRDVLNVLGMYPGDPGDPGVEFAGLVVRAGANVSHVSIGDEVIGIGSGTFAAYVTGPAAAVVRAPQRLNAVQAAAIPLAFLTAEWGLTDLARLQPGERVLIHAATGGVGQAAVSLALARGAEVYATAGSPEKRQHLHDQGVRHVFDSRSTSFADDIRGATNGEGVDVVLNSLAGEFVPRSLELLRDGGRFLEIGKADLMDPVEVATRYPGVRYTAYDLGTLLLETPAIFQSLFQRITARVDSGALSPMPVRVYDAEAVVHAFRFMAQARHIGKVVVSARKPHQPENLVRADGAYVVTGAGGGIGRALVEWLVKLGAGAVVMQGRSAPDEERQGWLDRLQASHTTRLAWITGDVGVPADVDRLLTATAALGSLRGVFHAAGVLDDGLLTDLTTSRFEYVMSPKVSGAWNLHRATRTHDLEHFVLFSSTASLLGGPGQAGYAAANAFLDALAERRAREGLAALSVSWGPWGDVGMASRLSERDRGAMRDRGVGVLSAPQALAALVQAMQAGRRHAVIVDMDWSRMAANTRNFPPLIATQLARVDAPAAHAGPKRRAIDLDALRSLDSAARQQAFTDYVCSSLAQVLGVRGGVIEPDAAISHLGFDSLMAMELRNRIEADLGIVVPVAMLLNSESAFMLAKQVGDHIQRAEPAIAAGAATMGWSEGEI